MTDVYKDDILDELSREGNIARFFSAQASEQGVFVRHNHTGLRGGPSGDIRPLVEHLMAESVSGRVNIRTFRPHAPEGNPFEFGIDSPDTVCEKVTDFLSEGYIIIVNEEIPVDDGGYSAVFQNGVVEIVPGQTPRGVEQGDPATLPLELAIEVTQTIFGIDISFLRAELTDRVEFSVHPRPCGVRAEHVIVWEKRPVASMSTESVAVAWPNALSRHIGDKAYGLVMAHLSTAGPWVPRTTVIARKVAPFTFGHPTGSPVRWSRSVPAVKSPGELPTYDHWVDPFSVAGEHGEAIESILSQDGVRAAYAGALMIGTDIVVEGVRGFGEDYMLGQDGPQDLPDAVVAAVEEIGRALRDEFGTLTAEWVYDESGRLWIVQVNQLSSVESATWKREDADSWIDYYPSAGVEALRELVASLPMRTGVVVHGRVGVTSHVGDILRRGHVPHLFDRG